MNRLIGGPQGIQPATWFIYFFIFWLLPLPTLQISVSIGLSPITRVPRAKGDGEDQDREQE